MGAEKNIVAIELGSSSIRGMLGQRKADGSLQVLGFEKEPVTDWITKGVVHNYDKTTQAISSIVKRLEERHKVYVKKAYVGVSGQSLRTVPNKVSKQFDVKVSISDEIIDSLKDENANQLYPESEILEVLPQEYIVDGRSTAEPVGRQADRIEGQYKNVIARRTLCQAINRCVTGAKVEVADVFIAPLFLAGYLLTEAERRSGCALVDFGAETTTVAIYEKNILRHLVVLPLGGNNITADIATLLHVEADEAEQLKRRYGKAYIEDKGETATSGNISISGDRHIEESRLRDIIIARQQEILANVWQQIRVYADRLLAGIVFTGGAAQMSELETAFTRLSNFDKKVLTRLMPTTLGYSTNLKLDTQATNVATLVAMLRRGEQECTSEIPIEPDLFEDGKPEDDDVPTADTEKAEGVVKVKPDSGETPKVGTKEENPAGQDDGTDKPEGDDEADSAKEPEAAQPKKPSLLSRIWRGFGNMVTEVTDPDK